MLAARAVGPGIGQRDTAYQSARSAGRSARSRRLFGVVGSQSAAGAEHGQRPNIAGARTTRKGQEQGVTLQEYAITQRLHLISRTQAGEKYQAPDGSWQTRGAGAPVRDARCP